MRHFVPPKWTGKIGRFVTRVFIADMPLGDVDDYNGYWLRRPESQPRFRYKFVADDLPDTGTVLDIGCGDGSFLKYLHDRKPNLELRGLDVSDVAVERARASGIHAEVRDVRRWEPETGFTADYVVMMEILEHLPDPESLMRNLRNTPMRRCYVTVPNLGHIEHRLRLGLAGKMPLTTIVYHIREHLRFWTVADFKHWAACMGYKRVRYRGQTGTACLWRVWPSLFAKQMIYVLEPAGPAEKPFIATRKDT